MKVEPVVDLLLRLPTAISRWFVLAPMVEPAVRMRLAAVMSTALSPVMSLMLPPAMIATLPLPAVSSAIVVLPVDW